MRTFFVTAPLAITTAAAIVAAAACSSTPRTTFGPPDAAITYASDASTSDAAFDFRACASGTHEAKLVPLDVFFMLDSSGSMLDPTGGGSSKWVSVTQAMTQFVNDPASQGISLALQFFPYKDPSVPANCTSDDQCGSYGPCGLKACQSDPTSGALQSCDTDADCASGKTCQNVGVCANDFSTLCTNVGGSCGGSLGNCNAQTGGTCRQQYSCKDADYTKTAVSLGALPGAGSSIVSAIQGRTPDGETPTGAALRGAIAGATAILEANPGHKVVVALASDGIPTLCSPTDGASLSQLAAKALATSGIQTFVIGVLAAADANAKPVLDQIAQGGGTTQAFAIDASNDVASGFKGALDEIRGASLACQFPLPAGDGGTVDQKKVNVTGTGGDGATAVYGHVDGAGSCDTTLGGWYWGSPVAGGNTPQIVLCPATCSKVKADPSTKLDIVLGCDTNSLVK